MQRFLVFIFLLFMTFKVVGQSVGIGSSNFTPDESAALEIRSNSKGLLIPKMLKGERDAITNPAKGLLVFQENDQSGFYYYDGTKWELLGANINDNDSDPTNEIQVLRISNDTIYLSKGGGFVHLPTGTIGAQTLDFQGTVLTINPGNSVDLAPLKDNMGNHEASKNIVLFSHFISGDGDDEGISITSNGDVLFSNEVTVTGEINLLAGSINRAEIEDDAINEDKLADNSVSTVKIQNYSVVNNKIGTNSISTDKLQNLSVSSGKLQDNAVTSGKLNNGAVINSKIADNAVITSKINDGAVLTSKIGDGQITGSKISSMNANTDSFLKWDGGVWIPSSIGGVLNYKGIWNAQQNVPVVSNAIGVKGDFYIVEATGTQDFGSGSVVYSPGDWILYNGNEWDRVNNSNEVNSVFGRKGIITAQSGDYTWAQIDKSTSFLSDISEVMTSNPDAGHVLLGNGSHWISSSLQGDITLDKNGNTLVGNQRISYDKLQNAGGTNGTVIMWTGSQWEEVNITSLITDEIQDPTLSSSNILGLTKSSVTVDLSPYLDNTDSQDLSLLGNELKLSNDATSVDLSKYLDDTDSQNLTLIGTVLSIANGNSVDFQNLANSVVQDLGLTGNVLSLTQDPSTVDLGKYLDNTDNQTLSLSSSNELKISNTASIVDLSKYLDNTDNQELSLSGTVLSISGGVNGIDFSTIIPGDNQDLQLVGDQLILTNDNSSVDLSKYLQNLYLDGSVVKISDATGVDISPLLNLRIDGVNLSISGSNTVVDLSQLNDDLGDHIATQKLQLGANKIGYGSEDKGLSFNSNGYAFFTDRVTVPLLNANDVSLGNNSIQGNEISDGAISMSKIEALSDGQIIIGSDGTTSGNHKVVVSGDATLDKSGQLNIANNAVTSAKISDGTITSADIADFTIQTVDLSDGSVNSVKLANSSVVSDKILDGAITTAKLSDGSVTSSKLSSMSANTDDVLMWDGTSWSPMAINGTLDYQGVWDPVANNPTLNNGDINISGHYYVVSQDGSVDLGAGTVDFFTGDMVLGTTNGWKKLHHSNSISSVFGRSGVITAETGDYSWNQIDKTVSSVSDISDVNASNLTSGNVLISDGSKWNSRSLTGDVTIQSNGVTTIGSSAVEKGMLSNNCIDNSKIEDYTITYTKLQNASGSDKTVLMWDGSAWVESLISTIESDGDSSNELQSLNLTGDDLSLSINNSTVNLAKYLDNTDGQTLSLVGTQLSISGGNNIDLSGFASTDSQELSLVGNTLNLTRSATSVDLSLYLQSLGLNPTTNILSISDGNQVDLTPYKDNTDNQDLTLTGDLLSLTNDATTVDLNKYLDNTDNQSLSVSGHNLTISGANTIDISSADSQDLSLTSDILSLTRDATTVDLSLYRQNLSLTATSLAISGGNSIDISSIDTDDQTLNFSGTNLSIADGNSVDLVSLKDNLGNHTATQNILLGSNWLSNDGTAKGIAINSSGDVNVNKKLVVDELFSANDGVKVSGSIVVGANNADASALMDLNSTSKGVLLTRMTTAQRDVIPTPATGLMIYNTTTNGFNYYNGTIWQEVGGNDNLGDHTATQNISLQNNYISNDGDAEGISIDNNGNVTVSGTSQLVGDVLVGSGSLDPSAAFEVESTTKGMLLPRMTQTEREAISSPAKGLMVFDNTLNSLFTYNGTQWVSAEASANTWNVSGNTTINETTDFLGSVNAADVVIKTQNAEVVRITKDSRVGIGTVGSSVEASAKLEVKSTTQGFLPPRMTSAERNAISNPAIGLVVFDTNRNNLYMYTGIWTEIGVPIGSIQAFMGTTIPDGWMLCDGSTFDGTTYPELQNTLGSTTLPDLRGVFLRGLDDGRGFDTGRVLGSYQADELKSHNHSYLDVSTNNEGHIAGGPSVSARNSTDVTRITNSTGGIETRPKNVAVNYIIRVK